MFSRTAAILSPIVKQCDVRKNQAADITEQHLDAALNLLFERNGIQ